MNLNSHLFFDYRIKHGITILVMYFSLWSGVVYAQVDKGLIKKEEATLRLAIQGKHLQVEAYIPRGITEFELRIESDRNRPVSGAREISSTDPDPEARAQGFQISPLDVRYPVVDIELEPGMDGVCVFKDKPEGEYVFGGPFYRESLPLQKEIILPAHKLEYWENSLMCDYTTPPIEKIYLRKVFPVVLRDFKHTINLLSYDWSGTISLVKYEESAPVEIASAYIQNRPTISQKAQFVEQMKGSGLSRRPFSGGIGFID